MHSFFGFALLPRQSLIHVCMTPVPLDGISTPSIRKICLCAIYRKREGMSNVKLALCVRQTEKN